MNPVEKEIVRRKLTVIVENLKALEPIKDMTGDEYMRDFYKRKATERLLQEIIEAAVDINTHIIVQIGHTVPDDYYGTFIKAGELKIISTDLAEKLAPSAGLRNRLVHEYDLIDHFHFRMSMWREAWPKTSGRCSRKSGYIQGLSGSKSQVEGKR